MADRLDALDRGDVEMPLVHPRASVAKVRPSKR
jgi:hypothetical protein